MTEIEHCKLVASQIQLPYWFGPVKVMLDAMTERPIFVCQYMGFNLEPKTTLRGMVCGADGDEEVWFLAEGVRTALMLGAIQWENEHGCE